MDHEVEFETFPSFNRLKNLSIIFCGWLSKNITNNDDIVLTLENIAITYIVCIWVMVWKEFLSLFSRKNKNMPDLITTIITSIMKCLRIQFFSNGITDIWPSGIVWMPSSNPMNRVWPWAIFNSDDLPAFAKVGYLRHSMGKITLKSIFYKNILTKPYLPKNLQKTALCFYVAKRNQKMSQ